MYLFDIFFKSVAYIVSFFHLKCHATRKCRNWKGMLDVDKCRSIRRSRVRKESIAFRRRAAVLRLAFRVIRRRAPIWQSASSPWRRLRGRRRTGFDNDAVRDKWKPSCRRSRAAVQSISCRGRIVNLWGALGRAPDLKLEPDGRRMPYFDRDHCRAMIGMRR